MKLYKGIQTFNIEQTKQKLLKSSTHRFPVSLSLVAYTNQKISYRLSNDLNYYLYSNYCTLNVTF